MSCWAMSSESDDSGVCGDGEREQFAVVGDDVEDMLDDDRERRKESCTVKVRPTA